MRLIKVTAPQGKGTELARLAQSCGILEVSVHQVTRHKRGQPPETRDVLDAQLSTPEAKTYVDALIQAPFFNRTDYAVEVREARSILKRTPTRELTRPVPAPILDIDEELWQYTHVTSSFAARVLIAAVLIAYGMVRDNLLFVIGGLIFLPFMPIVLALGFGTLTRQWRLVGHGLLAFVAAIVLIGLGGVIVAVFADPPMMFDSFVPTVAGLCFSLLVGIAGALGTGDDTGHRQLVGLAAASQLALLPAWFGISLVFGFTESIAEKAGAFVGNATALVIGALATYAVLALRGFYSYGAVRRKEYEL